MYTRNVNIVLTNAIIIWLISNLADQGTLVLSNFVKNFPDISFSDASFLLLWHFPTPMAKQGLKSHFPL